MIPIDMGRGFASLFRYIDEKIGWFISQGPIYTQGYLDGAGRTTRALTKLFGPFTGKMTDVYCAEIALKKLHEK